VAGLGAVILSYGPGDRHRHLLEDLAAQGLAAERIVVVHNPRSSFERHRPAAPDGAAVLFMERNRGYGAAMNDGLHELARRGASLGLLLTHDTRLSPGALEALAAAVRERPRYGVLGLVVEYPGAELGRFYGAHLERGRARHLQEAPAGAAGPVFDVDWVDGSAMGVRLVAWHEAGYLPGHYFMYFEEADFASRVREQGWGVGMVLAGRARSAPGVGGRRAAYGYLYSRNGLDWARRRRGGAVAARFALARLSSVAQVAASATRRHLREPAERNAHYAEALGSLLGLADALRGRFGPPPPRLARRGDIEGERS